MKYTKGPISHFWDLIFQKNLPASVPRTPNSLNVLLGSPSVCPLAYTSRRAPTGPLCGEAFLMHVLNESQRSDGLRIITFSLRQGSAALNEPHRGKKKKKKTQMLEVPTKLRPRMKRGAAQRRAAERREALLERVKGENTSVPQSRVLQQVHSGHVRDAAADPVSGPRLLCACWHRWSPALVAESPKPPCHEKKKKKRRRQHTYPPRENHITLLSDARPAALAPFGWKLAVGGV